MIKLLLEILLSITSISRSRRLLLTDMIIYRRILKKSQITLLPCFVFIHKTGIIFIVYLRKVWDYVKQQKITF